MHHRAATSEQPPLSCFPDAPNSVLHNPSSSARQLSPSASEYSFGRPQEPYPVHQGEYYNQPSWTTVGDGRRPPSCLKASQSAFYTNGFPIESPQYQRNHHVSEAPPSVYRANEQEHYPPAVSDTYQELGALPHHNPNRPVSAAPSHSHVARSHCRPSPRCDPYAVDTHSSAAPYYGAVERQHTDISRSFSSSCPPQHPSEVFVSDPPPARHYDVTSYGSRPSAIRSQYQLGAPYQPFYCRGNPVGHRKSPSYTASPGTRSQPLPPPPPSSPFPGEYPFLYTAQQRMSDMNRASHHHDNAFSRRPLVGHPMQIPWQHQDTLPPPPPPPPPPPQRGFGYSKCPIPGSKDIYCTVCDKAFPSSSRYKQHIDEDHYPCDHPGCSFSAPYCVLDAHKLKHIQGENRRDLFDDPDEIQRWIEARRRNFPSRGKSGASSLAPQGEKKQKPCAMERVLRSKFLMQKGPGHTVHSTSALIPSLPSLFKRQRRWRLQDVTKFAKAGSHHERRRRSPFSEFTTSELVRDFPICDHFLKFKTCKWSPCHYSHDIAAYRRWKIQRNLRGLDIPMRPPLLYQLLLPDIRKSEVQILAALQYIVRRNFFRAEADEPAELPVEPPLVQLPTQSLSLTSISSSDAEDTECVELTDDDEE